MPARVELSRWSMIAALMLLLGACTASELAPIPITEPGAAPSAGSTTTILSSTLPVPTTTEPDTSTAVTTVAPLLGLALESVDVDVAFPVLVFSSGPDTYVAGKAGMVVPIAGGIPVLDIRSRVLNDGERGLLGAAFHPLYAPGSLLVVHYTDRDGNTVVSTFTVDKMIADPESEQVVLRVEQPAGNHNGGMIQFDTNGHLFVGLGDGGGADDRFGNGQNLESLLGSILRLSITDGAGYTIPAGNPFVDLAGVRPEIWAWGLRNPWRFWIDDPSGTMVIGDVGQNSYEEIDVIAMGAGGANFGWPITEGLHCSSPSAGCDTVGLTLPVLEVSHDDSGSCSVTGGIVYRGEAIPELVGTYFYSDYCGGYLRGFPLDDPTAVTDYGDQMGGRIGQVTSFGQGADGEMYITTSDAVLKVVPTR